MNIGFQGWFLTQPHTGIGQHCIGLLKALAKSKGTKVQVVVPKRTKVEGLPPRSIKILKTKWWLLHPALKKWYWERVQVPAYFAKINPDWEYYPYPCPLPRYSPNLRAMTVHDTILWTDERYQGNKLKTFYHRKARQATIRADHVFTVSNSTHKELNIPAASVLPNAIPEIPKKLPKLKDGNALIYLGGYDIRKNVPLLIKEFKKLKKKYPEMQLLLIGKPHHKSKNYPDVPDEEGVKKLGPLTDKKVYAQLKSAFAFVHFSDSEGFNIPLLQAMTIGTPAIVADIQVNHEVSDNSALFLDAPLSDKVKALKNPKKRQAVIKKQKQAAKKYSWDKSAKIFLKTLKRGR